MMRIKFTIGVFLIIIWSVFSYYNFINEYEVFIKDESFDDIKDCMASYLSRKYGISRVNLQNIGSIVLDEAILYCENINKYKTEVIISNVVLLVFGILVILSIYPAIKRWDHVNFDDRQRFLGHILVTVGVLIMLTAGACTLILGAGLIATGDDLALQIAVLTVVFAGVPLLVGNRLFRYGRKKLRLISRKSNEQVDDG